MALERRDPLPPGRYSIFLLTAEMPQWQAWVRQHSDRVHVDATIDQRAVGGGELTATAYVDTDGNIIWKTVGAVLLFTVKAPVPWVGIGLPDIETRPIGEWKAEHSESPTAPGVLDQVRNLLLLGAGVYLAGAWLQRRS